MLVTGSILGREMENIANQGQTPWPRRKILVRFSKNQAVDKKSNQSDE